MAGKYLGGRGLRTGTLTAGSLASCSNILTGSFYGTTLICQFLMISPRPLLPPKWVPPHVWVSGTAIHNEHQAQGPGNPLAACVLVICPPNPHHTLHPCFLHSSLFWISVYKFHLQLLKTNLTLRPEAEPTKPNMTSVVSARGQEGGHHRSQLSGL